MKENSRDRHQDLAMAFLVNRYLPQYRFAAAELKMFPKAVFETAVEEIADEGLPPGFE